MHYRVVRNVCLMGVGVAGEIPEVAASPSSCLFVTRTKLDASWLRQPNDALTDAQLLCLHVMPNCTMSVVPCDR